jgi:spore coat polysaccharide biosynthesis protein SpsF (cytidylyltransferase family)
MGGPDPKRETTPGRPLRAVVAILQARMGSSRLPGKVMMDIRGKPMLARVLERVLAIPAVDRVVLATTTHPRDEVLLTCAESLGVAAFAGSEDDVLDRYYQGARKFGARIVVRITADCPLLDPAISGAVVARLLEGSADYASNTDPRSFPVGLDTEAFWFPTLEQAWHEARLPYEREHVTPYIRNHPERFSQTNVAATADYSSLRWTVDTPRDLDIVRRLYEHLPDGEYGYQALLAILEKRPELVESAGG